LNSIRQCRPLLGTYVEIYLQADEKHDALLDRSLAAFEEIDRIQKLMSFHDPESELTRINQTAHLAAVEIGFDLWRVLVFAQELYLASGGFFDPTIAPELVRRGLLPDHGNPASTIASWDAVILTETSVQFSVPLQIDLGGIAKGYAVDRALDVIGNEVDATVNAGGDLAMTRWQGRDVEIRTPGSSGRDTLTMPMENRSLATSAAYFLENQPVILNPHDRRPFAGKQSASVFADSCMVADALTKVALLLPEPAVVLYHFDASGFIIGLEGGVKRL
jgi:FAD:protein FMN transferase